MTGVPDGSGPALCLVTVEEKRATDAFDRGRELPAEVDRILDRGVVAEAAGWGEQMHRITAEEDPTPLEALGDKRVTCRPRVAREDRCVNVGAHGRPEHRHRARLADVPLILPIAQLRVEREFASPVHGGHERSPIPVERDVHPRRTMRDQLVELRGRQIDRVHATAEKVANHAGFARPADAQLASDVAMCAVPAHKVPSGDLARLLPLNLGDDYRDNLISFDEVSQAPAVVDRDSRQRFGMAAQHLLDILL